VKLRLERQNPNIIQHPHLPTMHSYHMHLLRMPTNRTAFQMESGIQPEKETTKSPPIMTVIRS